MAAWRPVRCRHELPAGGGDPGLRRAARAWTSTSSAGTTNTRQACARSTDPAFAARVDGADGALRPGVVAVQLNLLGSHDAPRMRTVLGGDVAGVRLATLLQATLPGAPCVYYGDEVGLVGGNDPGPRGAFPWDRARWDAGPARVGACTVAPAVERERPPRQSAARRGRRRHGVAFDRGAGSSRFVVAANAGQEPGGSRSCGSSGRRPAAISSRFSPPRLRRRSRSSDRRRRRDHPRRPTARRRPSRGLTRSFR